MTSQKRNKVLIAGGSGLTGKHLCKRLIEKGYDVSVLSRRSHPDKNITPVYLWDPDTNYIDSEAVKQTNYIINLSGAGIGDKRWTGKRKQEIIDSRVKTGELLFNEVIKHKPDLKAYISSSAVGYYGTISSEKIFSETDPPSSDFLGQVCMNWEESANNFTKAGIRTVILRTGIVLSGQGGALSKMSVPVKMGFGAAIGKGSQYLPWIHIDDLCDIYIKAIEDDRMKGACNAVAPHHLTNKQFTNILASLLKKALWLPNIPAPIMKIFFGEMSSILLKGSRISADKIQSSGYVFRFPELKNALTDILKEKNKTD